jgi:hypothetical protein
LLNNLILTRRQLLKLGLLTAVAPRTLFASTRAPWSFAVFSDTHYGVAGTYEKNEALLREIAALAPEFAVDAGDLTERAWPASSGASSPNVCAVWGVPFGLLPVSRSVIVAALRSLLYRSSLTLRQSAGAPRLTAL